MSAAPTMARVEAPRSRPAWTSSAPCTSIGIGGAGMSGIARIMLARGVRVSGSDRRDSPTLRALRALGARVEVGHEAAHLGDAGTVVVSTAIRTDNPELVAARERGLRVVPRAVALAAVMAGRRSVAVAGTHGKTSTTSMLTVAVQACGRRPVVRDRRHPQRVRLQRARRARATSSSPRPTRATGRSCCWPRTAAIVTNVEADHLDNYGDLAAVEGAFDAFVRTVPADGFLVLVRRRPGRGAAGRRRAPRPGCAPTARARAPTCGWSTCGSPPDGTRYTAVLDGAVARARCASGCPGSTWRSTAPRRCWPGSSSGCPPPG